MSSFFTLPKSQRKRKRIDTDHTGVRGKRRRSEKGQSTSSRAKISSRRDDSISGSESDEDEDDDINEHRRRRTAALEADEEESIVLSEEEDETPAERRIRLAERYLENIREEVDETGFDAEQIDKDLIAERLKEDVVCWAFFSIYIGPIGGSYLSSKYGLLLGGEFDQAESKGRLYRHVARKLALGDATYTFFRADTLPTTSIAACAPYVYTVSKDRTLIKWETQTPVRPRSANPGKSDGKEGEGPAAKDEMMKGETKGRERRHRRRPRQLVYVRGKQRSKAGDQIGHIDQILTVAASSDGQFVVTGGRDGRIVVWDAADLKPLRVFTNHREAVTALALRRGTNQLYSGSKDRTIKLWSLNELAYVETLFGHQDEVVDIAALAHERCVSVGARDRTARLWKVVEESQLVFRGGAGRTGENRGVGHHHRRDDLLRREGRGGRSDYAEGSMDRIALIDEETFVTGSDNGSLSLWNTQKKKAVFTMPLAHGVDPPLEPHEASAEQDAVLQHHATVLGPPLPRWITALVALPYSDLVLSGSWDGQVRAWRVATDKKSLEALGCLGHCRRRHHHHHHHHHDHDVQGQQKQHLEHPNEDERMEGRVDMNVDVDMDLDLDLDELVPGIINDITLFERGHRGQDGLCVVVALGTELRLGRWLSFSKGKRHGGRQGRLKNGAMIFEILPTGPGPRPQSHNIDS